MRVVVAYGMRRLRKRLLGALPAAALLAASAAFPALAQQQPIFGCRHAVSCRNPPIGPSALNDGGAGGLLVSGAVRWGPGFSFGLVAPALKVPTPAPVSEADEHAFHLRGVRLLPTPAADAPDQADSPTPTPTPTPTPGLPFTAAKPPY
jgi:hypothetical protein